MRKATTVARRARRRRPPRGDAGRRPAGGRGSRSRRSTPPATRPSRPSSPRPRAWAAPATRRRPSRCSRRGAGRPHRRAGADRRPRDHARARHVREHGGRADRGREGRGERVPHRAPPRRRASASWPSGRSPRSSPAPTTDRALLASRDRPADGRRRHRAVRRRHLRQRPVHRRCRATGRSCCCPTAGTPQRRHPRRRPRRPPGCRTNVIELVTGESNRAVLDQLAAAGGGSVSSATDPAALAGLYRGRPPASPTSTASPTRRRVTAPWR